MNSYSTNHTNSNHNNTKGMSIARLLLLLAIPIVILVLLVGGAVYIERRNRSNNSAENQEGEISGGVNTSDEEKRQGSNSNNSSPTAPTNTPTGSSNKTPTPTIKPTIASIPATSSGGTGNIIGTVRYPDGVSGSDLIVCAERMDKPFLKCTEKLSDKEEYGLTLPEGSYYVYAEISGKIAYYTDYVNECLVNSCGNVFENKAHKALLVNVMDESVVSNIYPWDW